MKRFFLIAVVVFHGGTIYGQQLNSEEFLRLSLEEKVDIFFNTYRDDHTHIGVSRFAEYIVLNHGYAVMPLIKERLEQANYFTYATEPKDITLSLIAYLMTSLHQYSNYPEDREYAPPYYKLTDDEIQWFFNEYMRRIEEYILARRVIDKVVLDSDINIIWVTCPTTYNEDTIVKFGYPFFGDQPARDLGNELKRYYEERLGIDLQVVPPFLE